MALVVDVMRCNAWRTLTLGVVMSSCSTSGPTGRTPVAETIAFLGSDPPVGSTISVEGCRGTLHHCSHYHILRGLRLGRPSVVVDRVFLAIIILIGAFVWMGPGVLLTPFAPVGFASVSDGTNTVFFQTREETAREMLGIARQTNRPGYDVSASGKGRRRHSR